MNHYIHPKAKIGTGVEIGHFSVIHQDVEIGEGTRIGPNVTVFPGARIGKRCQIFPSASIAATPQDLKFEGEHTTAFVGDDTVIRENVTINRGTKASGTTIVGSHCLIMACAHVAHDCVVGSHVVMANSASLGGHVVVDDYAVIGGLVGVHQFVKVGVHAMIAALSIARKDVPPFATAAGGPARYVSINATGIGRRDFSQEDVDEIREIYDRIYGGEYNTTQAVKQIEALHQPSEHRDCIIEFIKSSKRGIIKGR